MAQLLVAALLLVTTFQADFGIGTLSYLIWVDYFNLLEFMTLLAALVETLFVFYFSKQQENETALQVDAVFRQILVMFMNPLHLAGLVMFGNEMVTEAILLLSVGSASLVLLFFARLKYVMNNSNKEVTHAMKECHKNPADRDTLFELFNVFDYNTNYTLEIPEYRRVLQCIYPSMDAKTLTWCMHEVRKMADTEHVFDFEGFCLYHRSCLKPQSLAPSEPHIKRLGPCLLWQCNEKGC